MRAMRRKSLALLATIMFFANIAVAGQLVSTMRNVSAYMDYQGYRIEPAGTMTIEGDQGSAQLFEIVRPSMAGITIGRLYTSCTCIQLSIERTTFAQGEKAVLTVRNVLPTRGNTYPFYVQITSPVRATLRYDTYVISDQFVLSSPEIIVDSGSSVADSEIELIIPVADPAPMAKTEEHSDEPTPKTDAPTPQVSEIELIAPVTDPAPMAKTEERSDEPTPKADAPTPQVKEELVERIEPKTDSKPIHSATSMPEATARKIDPASVRKADTLSKPPEEPIAGAEPSLREVNAAAIEILKKTMTGGAPSKK